MGIDTSIGYRTETKHIINEKDFQRVIHADTYVGGHFTELDYGRGHSKILKSSG